jgi:signal transduction histidine kinase
VTKRRRWLWITIFVVLAVFLAAAATIWNVVIVQQYSEAVAFARDFAKDLATRGPKPDFESSLVWNLVLGGTMTFAALAGLILFFVKLLREMRFNQLQTEFLARVSHELKSPVTSLELTASLLRAGPSNEPEREKLWRIHESELHRLKVEIDGLLEASRWGASGFQPAIRPLNLEAWVDSSLPRWRQILGAEGQVERSGEKLGAHAQLDPKLMDLIANNFIDNARKFAQLSRPARVEVRTELVPPRKPGEGLHWRVSFRDAGIGFDPRLKDKLFERFFRAPLRGPHAIPGIGLGLFLAGAAARTLRLTIEASSEGSGRGACFSISGPISEAGPDDLQGAGA